MKPSLSLCQQGKSALVITFIFRSSVSWSTLAIQLASDSVDTIHDCLKHADKSKFSHSYLKSGVIVASCSYFSSRPCHGAWCRSHAVPFTASCGWPSMALAAVLASIGWNSSRGMSGARSPILDRHWTDHQQGQPVSSSSTQLFKSITRDSAQVLQQCRLPKQLLVGASCRRHPASSRSVCAGVGVQLRRFVRSEVSYVRKSSAVLRGYAWLGAAFLARAAAAAASTHHVRQICFIKST